MIGKSPEELAATLAKVERTSKRTMYAIVALAFLASVAVVILYWLGEDVAAGRVLTMIGPTLAALLAFRKGTENAKAIQEVHLSIDGRLTQLLEMTEIAAHAEGKAAGLSERKVRVTDTGP